MVHELDTANNYICIYEKIKFAPFFLAHPVTYTNFVSMTYTMFATYLHDQHLSE